MSKKQPVYFSTGFLQVGFVAVIAVVGLICYFSKNQRVKRFIKQKTPSENQVIYIKNDKIKGFKFLVSYDNRLYCQFIDLDKNGRPDNNDYCVCFERNPHPGVTKSFHFICGTHYPPSIDDKYPVRAVPQNTNRLQFIKANYLRSLPRQTTQQIQSCLSICKKLFK